MRHQPAAAQASRFCNERAPRVTAIGTTNAYVDADAGMTDSVIQTLGWGLVTVLLAVELILAVTSWVETGAKEGPRHRTPLLITRSSAIRDHFSARQFQLNALRAQYPGLRLPRHGRRVRDAVRHLQPTRLTATLGWCLECRGSMMRGLPRCAGCGRRLVEPVHAGSA